MKPLSSFLTGLLAGAAIGGVIALLYAPQSGKDTREQIKQKFKKIEEELENLKGKAGEKTRQMRDDLAARLAELQREIEFLSKEI